MQKNKHILITRFSALGDVAMIVPVLRRLVAQNPQLSITVATRPFYAPLFAGIPRVSVFKADLKYTYRGFFGLWKLANRLQKLQMHAVADLHNVLRTKILRFFFFFFGIKCTAICKGRTEKKALTRLTAKTIRPLKSTHESYADVFRELGFPVDLSTKITVEKPSLPKNLAKMFRHSSRKWIGVAPFAAHETKMYPLDLMEEVIAQLNASETYELFLFGGGKQEREIAEKLASKYTHVISIIGKFTFEEELNLIANLDLMLSMDSGNGHLAALFEVPVITLWGATHPYTGFAPFGQPEENQILPDLQQYPFIPTSVYGNRKVAGYEEVMYSISPKKVLEKIKTTL